MDINFRNRTKREMKSKNDKRKNFAIQVYARDIYNCEKFGCLLVPQTLFCDGFYILLKKCEH